MGELRNVLVIGAGTMGHGIAQIAAAAGFETRLHDVSRARIELALDRIRANLDQGVEKGKVTPEERKGTLARIQGAADLDAAARQADLVVEAVFESVELKSEILARLDQVAPDHTILATNTSSLSVTQLAAATGRPDRVVGMHFFNPPHILKLVELVSGHHTSDEVLERAKQAAQAMGKETITVRDSPGFATSRLGVALGLEAIRMVEEQVARPEDIDQALVLGYRHPMGPLRLTDLVGLDVRLAIAEHLFTELGDRFRPPQLLRQMVRAGDLGQKSGRGFYRWDSGPGASSA